MPRTYAVTGAASGIGMATATLLAARGHRVVGVDMHDADVVADLSTHEGRLHMVGALADATGDRLDAVIAVAGLATPSPDTVSVNYFGMTETLDMLRPMLSRSPAPRAVGVSSMASLMPADTQLVDLMLHGDEAGARARAEEIASSPDTGNEIYASTKVAFCRWVRRSAAMPRWAGAGIPLNAIAPGVILTPMVEPFLATEEGREMIAKGVPMPLNGFAPPEAPAYLLAWLASEENTHLCGQVIFIDGGADVIYRGDSTW